MDLEELRDPGGDQDEEREKHSLNAGLICPSCYSKVTRRSMRRSVKDRLMSLFGVWPYRCQMCNMRFNGPQNPAAIERYNEKLEIKAKEHKAAAVNDETNENDSFEPGNPADR